MVTSSESSTVPVISTPTTSDPVTIVTPLIMSPSITTTTSTISVPVTESVSTPMTPSTRAVAPLMFSPSISTVPILTAHSWVSPVCQWPQLEPRSPVPHRLVPLLVQLRNVVMAQGLSYQNYST